MSKLLKAASVERTGDVQVDPLLWGVKWTGDTISYSAPDSVSDYEANFPSAPLQGLAPLDAMQQTAMQFALDADRNLNLPGSAPYAVEAFTELTIEHAGRGSGEGLVRAINSDVSPTASATGPSNFPGGGHVTFGAAAQNPVASNYSWHTMLHELGHALGLKHGHEDDVFGALPTEVDSFEFTLMTYTDHVGQKPGDPGYEWWGAPQTFMMLDIAALQALYGAGYDDAAEPTIYTWDEATGAHYVDGELAIEPGANRVFMTIWDGGGFDTYDLSNYVGDVAVDLRPGRHSLLSDDQRAYLGGGPNGGYARGNVFNALLHEADPRSLIERAIGGTGDDALIGNDADNVLAGLAGNDTLSGGDGVDLLSGGAGDDRLSGGGGDDRLVGATGNDRGDGGAGDDDVRGNEGDDALFGGAGADTLLGQGGDDLVDGGDGDDVLNGGGGGDRMVGGEGDDTALGGLGDDVVRAGAGDDQLRGNAGADRLSGGSGADAISGHAGADTLEGNGGADKLNGGDDDDVMRGGGRNDTLLGGAGDDRMDGGRGSDTLRGDEGADELVGGSGADRLLAGAGADTITAGDGGDDARGGGGDDVIRSGDGNDAVFGQDGDDIIDAGAGNDRVSGGTGADRIALGDGDDDLRAGAGDDIADGGAGDDEMRGDDGDDDLAGGGGSDRLFGKAGDDTLAGGFGDDTLGGGAGRDTAVFEGALASYAVSRVSDGVRLAGEDGTDLAYGIETFVFADASVAFVDLF